MPRTRTVTAAIAAAALLTGAARAAPFERIVEIKSPTGITAITIDDRIQPPYVIVADTNGGHHRLVAGEERRPGLVALPNYTVPEPERHPDMLPDGLVARGGADIRLAYLIRPTRRYPHGALGDDIEAGGLHAVTTNGTRLRHILDRDSVFEDRRPRLADIDRDGRDEIIVVRSYLNAGAALAVFSIVDGRLDRIAETPPLGQPNRWLNPVGVADFDGDGKREIAVVTTPHIGGTLRLYRLRRGKLRQVQSREGFSNHVLGDPEQGFSAMFDADGDGITDIVIPDDRRTALRIVGFALGRFDEILKVPHGAPIVTALRLFDIDGDGRRDLIYGLGDGTIVVGYR